MISLKIAMRQNSIQIQMIYFKFENSISVKVMRKKGRIYLVQENVLLYQVSFISPSKSNHYSSENCCVHTQGCTYKTSFPSLPYGLISTGYSQWEVLTRTEQSKKNEVGQSYSYWRRKWQPTLVFLPGESQGWQSLVGCRLWGRTELDTTEATQQQQQQQQSCSQSPPPSGIASLKELNQKSQPFSQSLARSSGNFFLCPS